MNDIANKTTFWTFLGHVRTVVPKIQRDYAQGRKGKESLRESFLSSLKAALDDSRCNQLKLDFVYGSSDNYGNFTPLDGQQRITTLWLLHWYLAFRTGELGNPEVKGRLKNFSYETRQSSRQLIDSLVEKGSLIRPKAGERISDAIMRQSWMFSRWRQDPTIQSMLRMLSGERNTAVDGIEELFAGNDEDSLRRYWYSLKRPANECPIVFYQLDIDNLGQTDDLYVKMNGRGKPLSDFENFKADLIKYFEDKGWSSFLDPEKGYPILMDTKWMDFFWQYKNDRISLDDLFFQFINRYLLVRLMQDCPKLDEESTKDEKLAKSYEYFYSFIEAKHKSYTETGFGVYKTLFSKLGGGDAWSVFYDFREILNSLSAFGAASLTAGVDSPYYTGRQFKAVYVESSTENNDLYSLTQPQLIAFWAVCHYFSEQGQVHDAGSLRRWMRLVWNSCDYNTEIRSKPAVTGAIHALSVLVAKPHDSYRSLAANKLEDRRKSLTAIADNNEYSAFGEHLREEIEKIGQMGKGLYTGSVPDFIGKDWETVIEETEKLPVITAAGDRIPVLAGTIRAVIMDSSGKYDWSSFDEKYTNLKWYVDRRLDSLAARNILRWNLHVIRNHYYFDEIKDKPSTGCLSAWRVILARVSEGYMKMRHDWLSNAPLYDPGLRSLSFPDDYCQESLVRTCLIDETKVKDGIYLAYSSNNGYWVLIHHQASHKPYVVFNRTRNDSLCALHNSGDIILDDPDCILKCGLVNGRDIRFARNGVHYCWKADNTVQQDGEESGRKCPSAMADAASLDAFLSTLAASSKPSPDPAPSGSE